MPYNRADNKEKMTAPHSGSTPLLAMKGIRKAFPGVVAVSAASFELQPGDIGKHGLVNDPVAHGHVKARMTAACAKRGLVLRGYFESTVAGGDGNREHFVWAQKP